MPAETTEHTPGPWHCFGGAVYSDGTHDDPRAPIAFMCRDDRATKAGIYPVERDTNARLIAAAPDLLEACRAQHEAIDRLFALLVTITHARGYEGEAFMPSKSGQPWQALTLGHAAIAKAVGRE